MKRLIMVALVGLGVSGLTGCQTTKQYSANGQVLVKKPGMVAVDATVRKETLIKLKQLKNKCRNMSRFVPVLMDVSAPEGYGLDDRYNRVSEAFRSGGAGCLGGNNQACKLIQKGALEWATKSHLDKPRGTDGGLWNDTLTINMRLLNPLISALGVAEAFVPMSLENRKIVDPWLAKIKSNFEHGMRSEGNYNGGDMGTFARKAAHNHAIQSSLVAMSYGSWIGDDNAFSLGLEQWNITLSSMRKDGSLPIETRRGARALFYQGRTIAALIQIAERAKVQGIDLYNLPPSPEKSIHKAVEFLIEAIRNPQLVLKYAKTNHAPGPSKNYKIQDLGGPSTLSWIAPYIAQFPSHANTVALLNFKGDESYLAPRVAMAVSKNGNSLEWIGVDARCFYAN